MKTALITGASSGIGKAAAMQLAEIGYNLILTGRRKERLYDVKKEIESKFSVEIKLLFFDITILKEVKKAISEVELEINDLDLLINNAGLAVGLNTVSNGLIDDWERMINTNIKGLLYITREIVPIMIKNNKGHIINISSIAGKEVYVNGNVYCATKHAVEALTKALRIELVGHNIKVTSISPGAVNTEFSVVRFKGDQETADRVYDGYIPLNANDIAEAIIFAVTRKPHVNINDILIMPTSQASATIINKK